MPKLEEVSVPLRGLYPYKTTETFKKKAFLFKVSVPLRGLYPYKFCNYCLRIITEKKFQSPCGDYTLISSVIIVCE